MLYLSPAEDPEEFGMSSQDGDFSLPTRENDEFKGFQRKMYEMDFWREMMTATSICGFLSCFQGADIEIYWPLLLVYFIFMTTFLCRVKIEHMIKYKYNPFPFMQGKNSYK